MTSVEAVTPSLCVCSLFAGGTEAASLANARASIEEPGIARFDVLQDLATPATFVLVELFRTADAPAPHKATAHYGATWCRR